jgi:hypothetical protein
MNKAVDVLDGAGGAVGGRPARIHNHVAIAS